VGTDCAKITKNKLATSGVASCWCLIVFLTENYIYIRHISSIGLASGDSPYAVQRNLEKMVKMFDEYVAKEGKSHLLIEYVCLVGGIEDAENKLSTLGHKTTSFCLNPPSIFIYKNKYVTSERLLTFLSKVVYVNLNINEKISETIGGETKDDSTGITVIAESLGQIRRLSLLVFLPSKIPTTLVSSEIPTTLVSSEIPTTLVSSEIPTTLVSSKILTTLVSSKIPTIFVLDPARSRPNLIYKTKRKPQSSLEFAITNKKIEFSLTSNFYLPPLDHYNFKIYSLYTLRYVFKDLIPNLQKPSEEEECNPNAESPVTDDEDQYCN
jgi:hypothetical protein